MQTTNSDHLLSLDMTTVPLEGANLIEASAGTGKTFTIANLYLRLILEYRLSVSEILVVTFTEKATKELKEKLRLNLETALSFLNQLMLSEEVTLAFTAINNSPLERILKNFLESQNNLDMDRALKQAIKRLRLAVVSFDEAAVFTIHGFCQRMLNENAFESGLPFDVELLTDDTELLTEIVNDFWRLNIQTVDDALAGHLTNAGFSRETLLETAQRLNGKEEICIDGKRSAPPDLNLYTGSQNKVDSEYIHADPDDENERLAEKADDGEGLDSHGHFGSEGEKKSDENGINQSRILHIMESMKTLSNEMETWAIRLKSPRFRQDVGGFLMDAQIFNQPYNRADKLNAHFDKLLEILENPAQSIKPPCIFSFSHLVEKRSKKAITANAAVPEHPLFAFAETLPQLKESYIRCSRQILVQIKVDFASFFTEAWKERKSKRGFQTFNDILLNLRRALRKDQAHDGRFRDLIRSKIKAAMIDEFQDTDPVQFEIFRLLFLPQKNSADFEPSSKRTAPSEFPTGQVPAFEPFSESVPMRPTATDSIPLFLIGDPKQSIYRFRGADIYAYLQAKQLVEKRWTLNTNYRAESGIIEALNYLFIQDRTADRSSLNPFAEPGIPYLRVSSGGIIDKEAALKEITQKETDLMAQTDPPDPGLSVLYLKNDDKVMSTTDAEAAVCDLITREIFTLVHAGSENRLGFVDTQNAAQAFTPLKVSDIAVLVRTRKEAAKVRAHLDGAGIPSVIQAGDNVFQSDEAPHMLALLTAVSQPADYTLRPFLLTPIMGKTIEDMEEIADSTIQGYYQRCIELHQIWSRNGFMSMFRTVMTKERGYQRILSMPGGERTITNILHLAELIHQHALESRSGIEGTLTWFRERLHHSDEQAEHEIHLERDADALQIITVHSSKGLEYRVVFCPFEWRRKFTGSGLPNQKPEIMGYYNRSHGYWELDLFPDGPEWDAHMAMNYHEILAENVRLLYVALTRAKNHCYLVTGDVSGSIQSALNYLLNGNGGIPLSPEADTDTNGDGVGERDEDGNRNENNRNRVDGYIREMTPGGTGMGKKIQALTGNMLNRLRGLTASSDNLIALREIPSEQLNQTPFDETLSLNMDEGVSLTNRRLPRPMENTWGIASFSWLTRNIGHGHRQAEPLKEDPDVSDELTGVPSPVPGSAGSIGCAGSIESVGSFGSAITGSSADIGSDAQNASTLPSADSAILPKGARTGLAIHEIFEKIDFIASGRVADLPGISMNGMDADAITKATEKMKKTGDIAVSSGIKATGATRTTGATGEIVVAALKKFGIIHPDKKDEYRIRLDAALAMVDNVLHTPIPLSSALSSRRNVIPKAPASNQHKIDTTIPTEPPPMETFQLSYIPPSARLNELEFFYPINRLTPKGLTDVFKQHGIDHVGDEFAHRIEQLDFNLRNGFMQGFVDLIFEYQGQYYILDWKSNWLGDHPDAYTSQAIEQSMIDACYILQYHIYLVAVDLWLSSKLPTYNYDTHFGGVIYAYVRGMNPTRSGSGIYFDRPTEPLIRALGKSLGVHHE